VVFFVPPWLVFRGGWSFSPSFRVVGALFFPVVFWFVGSLVFFFFLLFLSANRDFQVLGLSGELCGEGRRRVLCVFGRFVWIEILGSRSTLLSPLLHDTGLTFGFMGVLRISQRSACSPPPPPHRRVAFMRQGPSWRVMATRHSPGFHYHIGRRFLGRSGVFLLAAPPSPHRGSVWVVFFFCCFAFWFS
jgi:hypothetical protein